MKQTTIEVVVAPCGCVIEHLVVAGRHTWRVITPCERARP